MNEWIMPLPKQKNPNARPNTMLYTCLSTGELGSNLGSEARVGMSTVHGYGPREGTGTVREKG